MGKSVVRCFFFFAKQISLAGNILPANKTPASSVNHDEAFLHF